ncbi:MAG TPA: autotransporter domain-containing protein [Nevskiaceae bacterium]|nr:autotransporter domain-containing protein [Nevskiaceae bacterium]
MGDGTSAGASIHATIAAPIHSAVGFAKTDYGTLTLDSQANAVSGTATVEGGTLEIGDAQHSNATLAAPINVQHGAVLDGYGTTGSLTTSGVLEPGDGVGTLHVRGNATLAANSTYLVQVTSAGRGSEVDVSGHTTLQGGKVDVLGTGRAWQPLTQYSILASAQGITGTFGAVSTNLDFLNPVLEYHPQEVTLVLERNDILFASGALTPDAYNAANAADDLGWDNPLYDALAVLPKGTDTQTVFEQLSGKFYASQETARAAAARPVRAAMIDHARPAPLSTTTANSARKATAWADAWGTWGEYGGPYNSRIDDNGDGLLLGATVPVGSRGAFGVLGGGTRNTLSAPFPSAWTRETSTWIGAYGSAALGRLSINAGVAHSWDTLPTNRTVVYPGYAGRLSSNMDGGTTTAYAHMGWHFNLPRGSVVPFVTLARTQVTSSRITELNASPDLAVAPRALSDTASTLGAKVSLRVERRLDVSGTLGWRHTFGSVVPVSEQTYASTDDAFTVFGVPLVRNGATAGVAVNWHLALHVALSIGYHGLFGGGTRDGVAHVDLRVRF